MATRTQQEYFCISLSRERTFFSLMNWYRYVLHTHIHTHTNIHREHANICDCTLTLHGNVLSNGQETKNAKLPPVKRGKNLAQQKLPDGSEMRKGTGTGAAGYGKGKALTPISSATRRVPTHTLCNYSRLNWPLADGNGACVRAF